MLLDGTSFECAPALCAELDARVAEPQTRARVGVGESSEAPLVALEIIPAGQGC